MEKVKAHSPNPPFSPFPPVQNGLENRVLQEEIVLFLANSWCRGRFCFMSQTPQIPLANRYALFIERLKKRDQVFPG